MQRSPLFSVFCSVVQCRSLRLPVVFPNFDVFFSAVHNHLFTGLPFDLLLGCRSGTDKLFHIHGYHVQATVATSIIAQVFVMLFTIGWYVVNGYESLNGGNFVGSRDNVKTSK